MTNCAAGSSHWWR